MIAIKPCVVIFFHVEYLSGVMPETADKMVDALPILKERLQKSDPTVLFSAVNDLSKVRLLNTACII